MRFFHAEMFSKTALLAFSLSHIGNNLVHVEVVTKSA